MSVRPAGSPSSLLAGLGVLAIGILVALATDVSVTVLTPAKLAFLLSGVGLLLPTMVLEDPKSYGLFLLVLSIPFNISKMLSASLVDPQSLVETYGEPPWGTTAIEIYLTDVILLAMVLPWLARLCMHRERLYFPNIGYLFVLYLAWCLLISIINADSFYLAIFELFRQVIWFLFFVYLINNVKTRRQFRSIVLAMFLGFVISAGSVIGFFERGIGTEYMAFTGLHDQSGKSSITRDSDRSAPELTFHGGGRRLGSLEPGQDSQLKRSQGMFEHPAIAAGLCGLILPVVLAYLTAARTWRDRILFCMVYAWGVVGLVLTFSRAGAVGLLVGTVVFFLVGGWSRLITRRVLMLSAVAFTAAVGLSIPLLLVYFESRPGSFLMRFYLFETALQGYWQHALLGAGLNNGTAAMEAGRRTLQEIGIPMPPTESTDNFYLATLIEVGPLGFVVFVLFFGRIVTLALRTMREAAVEMKPLLVGIVAGLAALATQNLADDTLAGHAINGTLWLFVSLIFAAARCVRVQAEAQSSGADRHATLIGP